MTTKIPILVDERAVRVTAARVTLEGQLGLPSDAEGVVLFAHGSGSGRHSPRNRFVAEALWETGLATLQIDLLTAEEEAVDSYTAHLRFDVHLLAERLIGASSWLKRNSDTAHLPVGYFGASTGAGAALVAAAEQPDEIRAVVSRGGRPDLAGPALWSVQAPTLLIVGGNDAPVIKLNRQALVQLGAKEKQLIVIPGATHLFEEPGALQEVVRLAANWFMRHLSRRTEVVGAGTP